MQLGLYFQESFRNLFSHKLRTLLAILGILVGTASVVAMVSGGELATRAALKQFKALGTNLLSVQLNQQNYNPNQVDNLSVENVLAVKKISPDIQAVAPYTSVYVPMSFAGHTLNSSIVGVTDTMKEIMKIDMSQGRFISFLDHFENYCVIGNGLYTQLKGFSTKPIMGQQIQLGKSFCTVIGVAKPWMQNSFVYADLDNAVMVPLSTTKILSKSAVINSVIFRINEKSDIDALEDKIKAYYGGLEKGLSFYFQSAKQIIEKMKAQQEILTVFLGFIGSISLLVGGIGVMNIMLVSVTERRREIGIRLAIGAKKRDIQMMFLTEAITLSVFGGLVGVILGILVSFVIAEVKHWEFTLFIGPPVVGFIVSALVGIFFGFYPAHKAAKLDPITTLRSD